MHAEEEDFSRRRNHVRDHSHGEGPPNQDQEIQARRLGPCFRDGPRNAGEEGKVTLELPDGQRYAINEDWVEKTDEKPALFD